MSLSKRFFAAWYDLLNSGVEGRVVPYRRLTAGVAHGNVLEIGGGTGANLPFYPPDASITFIEPDPHMIRRLRRSIRKQGRQAAIVQRYGESLPFAAGSFDAVVTTLTLCMVSDADAVIRETRRVLKPGGNYLFYEHVVSPRSRGRWWQHKLNPTWKRLTTGCNLDRDLTVSICSAGFANVEFEAFDLSVGLPVTIPNIVGVAKA
ncbi:MAG: class I SAM-dependent methyltransferase [Chloroflexi bacterium]|nr:class I SAM-dependent methyltransferase [Chloroflexota bacterium]